MPRTTYLVNKDLNTKYRLNGIKPSNTPPPHTLYFTSAGERLYGAGNLPPKVDLRHHMTAVENQAQVASCVANTLAGSFEYLLKKSLGRTIDVSRLFIYYNARKKGIELTGGEIEDSGCIMAEAIEALKESGVCLESVWPYNQSKVNERPSDRAYEQAKGQKIDDAVQLEINLDEMKTCLVRGFPFAFGVKLFGSFDKAEEKGVVPMPDASESSREEHGFHAMLAVGYSDQSQAFIVRNSWGAEWGDQGYCYMPYEYLANPEYSFDVWVVKKVVEGDFGRDSWSYDDNQNYLDDINNSNNADRNNFAIETIDDNGFYDNSNDPSQGPWTDFTNTSNDLVIETVNDTGVYEDVHSSPQGPWANPTNPSNNYIDYYDPNQGF